jgi:hypothetical protein
MADAPQAKFKRILEETLRDDAAILHGLEEYDRQNKLKLTVA